MTAHDLIIYYLLVYSVWRSLKSAFTLVHVGSSVSSVRRQKQRQLTSLLKCCLGLAEVWSKPVEAVSKVKILCT